MGMIYLLLAAELLEKSYKSYLLGFLASKFIRLRLMRFLPAGLGDIKMITNIAPARYAHEIL